MTNHTTKDTADEKKPADVATDPKAPAKRPGHVDRETDAERDDRRNERESPDKKT